MASTMSAAYLRRCAGKKRSTKDEALKDRKSLVQNTGRPLGSFNVYRCDQCLGYHVGGAGNHWMTRTRRTGKRPNKRMRGRI